MNQLSSNLKYLRKRSGKTQDALSADLNIGRTTIANYEAGISEPSLETVLVFSKYFNTPVDELLSINLEAAPKKMENAQAVALSPKEIPLSKMPMVVTVDNEGMDNIIYVPVKARAGYLLGYGDPEFMETLTTFRLPGLNNSTFRMFEVEGPSMAPNILHGDRIIGEWLDGFEHIRDNRVHVIVHKGGVMVKRIVNRIKERGKIYLKSDTIAHRSEFPTVEIDPVDIIEIWYGRLKISSDFSEPAEVYHRLADLELDVLEMKNNMKKKD